MDQHAKEISCRVSEMRKNKDLQKLSSAFMEASALQKYSYNFFWQGRPIIQYPQDIVALQEIIWNIKPDLIIETGIAHGGSLIFSASMLGLLDMYDAIESGSLINPKESKRKVLGVDIDIRRHNEMAINSHPMASRIQMIQGSSISQDVINQVKEVASSYKTILVCLDSNHTHDHVLAELEAYSSLASIGSYCIVFDTVVDDLSVSALGDRPWGVGNNPKTAVRTFLKTHPEFKNDNSIQDRLLITVAPDGYLKKIK